MGDTPKFSSTGGQTAADYAKYLPTILDATAKSVLPTEQTLLDANKTLTPQKNDLAYDTLADNYKRFTNIGADQADLASDRAAQTQENLLKKYGASTGAAAAEALNAADPLAAKNRLRESGGLDTLFGSLDNPNEISGSEKANIERGIARRNISRGNEAPTATSTVEAGMQFGKEGDALKQQKQNAITNAVNVATGAAPALSNGINPATLTGRAQAANTGMGAMPGVSNAGATEFGFGNNAFQGMNQAAQSAQNNTSAHATSLMQDISAGVGIGNSMCCFIFMESYNGLIPKCVRRSRDAHMTPANRAGYIWMSKWLVPLMRKSPTVRELTNDVMIRPLTEDAASLYGEPGGVSRSWARKFWLGTWEVLGRITGVPISYKNCTGKKWTLGKFQVEYWKLPPMTEVPEHTHKEFASLIIPIAGQGAIAAGPRWAISTLFKPYKVAANMPHAVDAFSAGFSFINIQRWTSKPTSASVDFNLI